MKFQLKRIVAFIAIALVVTSCSNDENTVVPITGEGNLKLEFDNFYKTADFAINTNYTNSNGEVVSVSKVKYIVSNIVLTREDGSTYVYPKSQSYFIVDELTPSSMAIDLKNVPAGNYSKIKYGIGVDKTQWDLGATGQGNFLAIAQNAGMMWSWSAGYKFIAFEGTFTSPTVTVAAPFKVHTGLLATNYNYAEISLDFPEKALIRTNSTPRIQVVSDVSQLIDGVNKISLTESPFIMSGDKLPVVTANIANMFRATKVLNN
jgi:hypothetical protein